MSRIGHLLLVLLALASARTAAAVDGVIEINHARALAGGVTPGDAAGYPVTITQAGSYRLTGDLSRIGSGEGIEVTADRVTLDLGGFSVLCIDDKISLCSTGSGVAASTVAYLAVRNGVVAGFGAFGIKAGSLARIESVRVQSNDSNGIDAGAGSTVIDTQVFSNGGHGIAVTEGGTVTGNTAYSNTLAGISAGIGSTVAGNTTRSNSRDGIFADNSSTVIGNTVTSNIRCGLNLGVNAGYAQNVVGGNNGGNANLQVNGGIPMGTNVCALGTNCAAGAVANCP